MMRRPMCETWGEHRLECCGSYDRAAGSDLGDFEDLLRGNAFTFVEIAR
jgi:hypothetical protein